MSEGGEVQSLVNNACRRMCIGMWKRGCVGVGGCVHWVCFSVFRCDCESECLFRSSLSYSMSECVRRCVFEGMCVTVEVTQREREKEREGDRDS